MIALRSAFSLQRELLRVTSHIIFQWSIFGLVDHPQDRIAI